MNENQVEEHVEPVAVQEKTTVSKPKTLPLLAAGLAVALVGAVVVWYVVGIQSVKGLSESPFTLTTAKIFKIPVASINGEKIPYGEYVDNIRAMRMFYDTDTTKLDRPSDSEMSDYILSRLLINRLTGQVAAEYKVALNQADIDSIVNTKLLPSFENRDKAEEEITKRYGWSLDHFVSQIVAPTELEQKLAKTYLDSVKDPSKKEAVKAQAQAVLDRIKKGESFEKLAKEFGSDSSKDQGGDLGWFAKGVMLPEFENAAFALKKGQLSNELVETQYGFHIIRVDDKRTTKDKEGKSVEEVKARHILFPTNENDTAPFTTFMNQRLLSSTIKVSKGLHNPFEDLLKKSATSTDVGENTTTTTP